MRIVNYVLDNIRHTNLQYSGDYLKQLAPRYPYPRQTHLNFLTYWSSGHTILTEIYCKKRDIKAKCMYTVQLGRIHIFVQYLGSIVLNNLQFFANKIITELCSVWSTTSSACEVNIICACCIFSYFRII